MSWLYSRALVEEYSAASCLDGAQSALSSANHTPQAFLPSDKMTDFSRPSRFGMTFAPLTASLGAELLTWYLAGFHAKTSARPEKAQEFPANEVGCGQKWRELSVRYDRASCSWRTHRSLWDEDLSACSLTLPKWGLMRDGVLLELLTLEHRTAAKEFGLLPTPLTSDWKSGTTSEATRKKNSRPLRERVMWRTPSACVVEPKSTVVKLTGRKPTDPQVGLADQVGGMLNPNWVEWLMGWPPGWTDLKPLVTGKSHSAPPPLGGV